MIKRRTKDFANKLLADPTMSATQAYIETHQTNNRNAAKVEASKLLAKPNVQLYMNSHIDKAKVKIVDLVDSNREEIALKASESILDRALGKPTIRQEVKSTRISISLGDIKP